MVDGGWGEVLCGVQKDTKKTTETPFLLLKLQGGTLTGTDLSGIELKATGPYFSTHNQVAIKKKNKGTREIIAISPWWVGELEKDKRKNSPNKTSWQTENRAEGIEKCILKLWESFTNEARKTQILGRLTGSF